jgi:hypothetical protein
LKCVEIVLFQLATFYDGETYYLSNKHSEYEYVRLDPLFINEAETFEMI